MNSAYIEDEGFADEQVEPKEVQIFGYWTIENRRLFKIGKVMLGITLTLWALLLLTTALSFEEDK
jgi:hypothetical protein